MPNDIILGNYEPFITSLCTGIDFLAKILLSKVAECNGQEIDNCAHKDMQSSSRKQEVVSKGATVAKIPF